MHGRSYVYLIFSNLFMAGITGSSYPLWQPLSLFHLIAGFMPIFVLSGLTSSLCGHCFGKKGGGSGWRTSKSQLLERSLGFWNDLRWIEAHFLTVSGGPGTPCWYCQGRLRRFLPLRWKVSSCLCPHGLDLGFSCMLTRPFPRAVLFRFTVGKAPYRYTYL